MRDPNFNKDLAWIMFDGACQGCLGKCGAGMTLYLNDNHYFHLKLGVGVGTNTRVELIALWGFLSFSKSKDIFQIQIASDSKVIISWFN